MTPCEEERVIFEKFFLVRFFCNLRLSPQKANLLSTGEEGVVRFVYGPSTHRSELSELQALFPTGATFHKFPPASVVGEKPSSKHEEDRQLLTKTTSDNDEQGGPVWPKGATAYVPPNVFGEEDPSGPAKLPLPEPLTTVPAELLNNNVRKADVDETLWLIYITGLEAAQTAVDLLVAPHGLGAGGLQQVVEEFWEDGFFGRFHLKDSSSIQENNEDETLCIYTKEVFTVTWSRTSHPVTP